MFFMAKRNVTVAVWFARAPTARAVTLSCRSLRNTVSESPILALHAPKYAPILVLLHLHLHGMLTGCSSAL
jgi:hypothetical protein